jgi:predicted ATPase/class 3 adenylate cyclase
VQICPGCGEENPDRFRLCGFCGTPLVAELPPQETRKTVTIVFSDLKGSTAMGERLDSEAVREVMSRYFDEMRGALEQHGGTVEKYIGDAIMAVFGLPRLHEDDALRAVRAAAEMRERLAALNRELEDRWGVTVGNRTGVNTGEVVAGDASTGQRLATGDTVNTAARLEQAAPTNEVLLGETTYRLVRHAVEVEPVEPLELKGKAERVPAYRLVSVREGEGVERRRDSRLVGRERDLVALESLIASAAAQRACRTATVIAPAGVGKSRLIDELARSLPSGARTLRGRCLSYGRGITFWPLTEIVREVADIRDDDHPDRALEKLAGAVGSGADDVVVRVASAVGLTEASFPLDEVFWATRKLFEHLAAARPLVVVFDDLHWAEQALLDLIEHVAATASDIPLVLLGAARPEFLEIRPRWAASQSALIELQPLTEDASAQVVEQLLGGIGIDDAVMERIVTAAAGNPLFVEQLVSMLIDDGNLQRDGARWVAAGDLTEIAIPGTIQALLAARLDLLTQHERAVIEPAAVAGLEFQRSAVEELAPEPVRADVETHLLAMEQKQLVQAQDETQRLEYRFHHILIREAAYRGILKRARATFHERFVGWAERVNRERDRGIEYEAILGYHLEQAHQYLSELGPLDAHGLELGERAAAYLTTSGRRAFDRGDMAAAANLLRRAVALLPETDRRRLELLPDLGEALMETGEFAWAELLLGEAVELATKLGDDRLRADATLTQLLVRHHAAADLGAWREDVERATTSLIPSLEERDANAELAKAWRMVAWLHAPAYRWEAAAAAQQRALEHARRAGERRLEARMASAYAQSLCIGPTPTSIAVAECEALLATGLGHQQSEALIRNALALLISQAGDFDRGRALCREARLMLNDLGAPVLASTASLYLARVELLADAADAAEAEVRPDYERLREMGEVFFRSSLGAVLAQALLAQGKLEDAERVALESLGLANDDDVEVASPARSVRAIVHSRRGAHAEAIPLAEEAVALIPGYEAPLMLADALVDLAHVYAAAGERQKARAMLDQARALAKAKEASVTLARLDALLGGLDRLGDPARLASA